MKLSEFKNHLLQLGAVNFKLEDNSAVPDHFHVTEVGIVTRHFIDCGATERKEKVANFQLWDANDYDHRLKPGKLLNIIGLSEKVLGMEDLDIEVEYQWQTIGRYDLGFDGTDFILLSKKTACLAQDQCGVAKQKEKVKLSEIGGRSNCCTPESGCC